MLVNNKLWNHLFSMAGNVLVFLKGLSWTSKFVNFDQNKFNFQQYSGVLLLTFQSEFR